MARLSRLTLAETLHQVVWRGNNGQAVFLDVPDRERFLALLAELAARERVRLHAYVLLDNAVHLMMTPTNDTGVPRLMQAVGRSYVRWFNQRHGRSGTLWEGRYRSTLLEAETYLLPAMVAADLAPVRAGVVDAPEASPWSSHAHYIGLRQDRWLTPHPLMWALGNTPFAREAAYAERVRLGVSEAIRARLLDATLKGWALGAEPFLQRVQERSGRRPSKARAGRPVKPLAAPAGDASDPLGH
jgi:putative transposase